MKNETKIKGDKNFVFQGNKNSKFNIQNENTKNQEKQTYTILGVIITFVGIIATVIIGWDNIIKFFTKRYESSLLIFNNNLNYYLKLF